jgi:hypothetical protein
MRLLVKRPISSGSPPFRFVLKERLRKRFPITILHALRQSTPVRHHPLTTLFKNRQKSIQPTGKMLKQRDSLHPIVVEDKDLSGDIYNFQGALDNGVIFSFDSSPPSDNAKHRTRVALNGHDKIVRCWMSPLSKIANSLD